MQLNGNVYVIYCKRVDNSCLPTSESSVFPNISCLLWNFSITVELQWLEHLWDHENKLETGVVRANEGLIIAPGQKA